MEPHKHSLYLHAITARQQLQGDRDSPGTPVGRPRGFPSEDLAGETSVGRPTGFPREDLAGRTSVGRPRGFPREDLAGG